jgi:hypothetical protein
MKYYIICNISVELLFKFKKVFALKGQHKPARRNAAGWNRPHKAALKGQYMLL